MGQLHVVINGASKLLVQSSGIRHVEGAHAIGSVNMSDFHVMESLNAGERKLNGSCKFAAHETRLEGLLEPKVRNENEAQLMVNQTRIEMDKTHNGHYTRLCTRIN